VPEPVKSRGSTQDLVRPLSSSAEIVIGLLRLLCVDLGTLRQEIMSLKRWRNHILLFCSLFWSGVGWLGCFGGMMPRGVAPSGKVPIFLLDIGLICVSGICIKLGQKTWASIENKTATLKLYATITRRCVKIAFSKNI